MNPGPIQLLQVMFRHVKVELDPAHLPPAAPNPLTSVFVFDGVSIQTEISVGVADQDAGRDQVFFIMLRVVVDNQPNAELGEQKFCPYTLDVAAEGIVLVPEASRKLGAAEDVAAVNGASMLWSAAREQILAITSRMRAGPVMLPTVHFDDLKESAGAAASGGKHHARTRSRIGVKG